MMATSVSHVKIPPPRPLASKETLQSLQQWFRTFRQYYKRDDQFKFFTLPTTTWDPTRENYGFAVETTGLKRSAEEMKEDCQDFLHALAGYMPYGYLSEKFQSSVKSLKEAFDVICEHYGVAPSQESFLEFISLNKEAGESYRQYFERMLAFARQHLTGAGQDVDGVKSDDGDKLTISHMNLITLLWLKNIHPDLINIVKTEYSLELRQNTPLSKLVPRICVNIDNLLARHDRGPAVQLCRVDDDDDDTKQATIARVRQSPVGRSKFPPKKPFPPRDAPTSRTPAPTSRTPRSNFCPGCFYLGEKLGIKIHSAHTVADCPRQEAVVRMVEAEECSLSTDIDDLQICDGNKVSISEPDLNVSTQETRNNVKDFNFKEASIKTILLRVNSVVSKLRKEKSPSLNLNINGAEGVATIDEGAEVSIINLDLAKKAKLSISKTDCNAVAADKLPMRVIGQTTHDVFATVGGTRVNTIINLGRLLVISNLGADVLIGQPTKVDTSMITIPHKRMIHFQDIHKTPVSVSYNDCNKDLQPYYSFNAPREFVFYPGQELTIDIPSSFASSSKVLVSPKPSQKWLKPRILEVRNGSIVIKNNSNQVLHFKRNTPIVDVRSCHFSDVNSQVMKVYDFPSDFQHLEPHTNWDHSEDFTSDVSIDPENLMTTNIKSKFEKLVKQFSDVINYRPGKYNGWYGDINNSIDFATVPPPTSKIHAPKYSHDMMVKLAEQMDKLEKWNVLATPESVGVTPVYVSPSMLVPKDDGTWRMVTDFTGLNTHIRKAPASSPTIEEAKLFFTMCYSVFSLIAFP